MAFFNQSIYQCPGFNDSYTDRKYLGDDNFSTTVRSSSTNEEEVKKWLLDFQASSLCTWRVRQTFQTSGRYVLFKREYRCHHNTLAKLGANMNRKQSIQEHQLPGNNDTLSFYMIFCHLGMIIMYALSMNILLTVTLLDTPVWCH